MSYAYDSLGRKTALWQNAVGTGTKRAEWIYDTFTGGKGQLTSSTRWDGGNAYVTSVTGYNNAYQPLGSTVSFPTVEGALSSQGPWTSATSYNADGSVATQTLPAGGGLAAETITTGYDANGFVTSSASGLGSYLSSISYYPWGPTYQTVSGAAGKQIRLTSNQDEATRRLTSSVVQTQNQTTPANWDEKRTDTYTYDNSGQVVRKAEGLNGANVSVECFGYDQLQRLIQAHTRTDTSCTFNSVVSPGPDSYRMDWTYDEVGNRKTQTSYDTTGAPDTLSTTTYTYPTPGTAQPHTLTTAVTTGTGAGTNTYHYDPTGNTDTRNVAGTSQSLGWDPEGHLATHTINSQPTSYLYDPDGNRLLRRDPDGTTTAYLGGQELKKSPVGTLSGTRYYGSTASRTSAGLTWLAGDHHGTAQVSIDATTLAHHDPTEHAVR